MKTEQIFSVVTRQTALEGAFGLQLTDALLRGGDSGFVLLLLFGFRGGRVGVRFGLSFGARLNARILLGLLNGQANLALLPVNSENLDVDGVPDVQDVGNIVDALIRDFADVNEPFGTGRQLNKGSEFQNPGNDAAYDVADGEFVLERIPRIFSILNSS